MTDNAGYNDARTAYWEAQNAFRAAAERHIQSLMPEGVATVVLDLNDTPHLSVVDLLDANGDSVLDAFDGSEEYEAMDDVAADMESYSWDDAEGFLAIDGDRFIITKEG